MIGLFFADNLAIAIGVLYAKCAYDNSRTMTRALCWGRFVIGSLNLYGVMSERMVPSYIFYAGIEIFSAVLMYVILPCPKRC